MGRYLLECASCIIAITHHAYDPITYSWELCLITTGTNLQREGTDVHGEAL